MTGVYTGKMKKFVEGNNAASQKYLKNTLK